MAYDALPVDIVDSRLIEPRLSEGLRDFAGYSKAISCLLRSKYLEYRHREGRNQVDRRIYQAVDKMLDRLYCSELGTGPVNAP